MYKKVAFEASFEKGDDREIIDTVLTKFYPFMNVVERNVEVDHMTVSFAVNKADLKDLRHDVEVLVQAGFDVKEIEA